MIELGMEQWMPLESNPIVMNKFLQKVGVSDKWHIVDVYGLDAEDLGWVPKPVLAIILLFPCNENYEVYAKQQCNAIKENGQIIVPELFFLKQVVSNACGTIALIHSVANNTDKIELSDGTFKEILNNSKHMSPEERGEFIQKMDSQIMEVHQQMALEGDTKLLVNEVANHHFVSLVHKSGWLYELDGRKEFPINHGASSPETFLEDAAKVCKTFMEREPNECNFGVMALTINEFPINYS